MTFQTSVISTLLRCKLGQITSKIRSCDTEKWCLYTLEKIIKEKRKNHIIFLHYLSIFLLFFFYPLFARHDEEKFAEIILNVFSGYENCQFENLGFSLRKVSFIFFTGSNEILSWSIRLRQLFPFFLLLLYKLIRTMYTGDISVVFNE